MSEPDPVTGDLVADLMVSPIVQGLLEEYEHGFNDAFDVISSGMDAALKKAQETPKAQPLLIGLESSIYVIAGLKETFAAELNKSKNSTVETNQGDTTNG